MSQECPKALAVSATRFPQIKMPLGSRALNAVRTRKLPFPDSKPGVTGGGPQLAQPLNGPWQVGSVEGEQKKVHGTRNSRLGWSGFSAAYSMPGPVLDCLPGIQGWSTWF